MTTIPQILTRHGLLNGNLLLQLKYGKWQEDTMITSQVTSLTQLWALANKYNLTHLWVRTGCIAGKDDLAFCQLDETKYKAFFNRSKDRLISASVVSLSADKGRKQIMISWIDETRWNVWATKANDKQLLITIAYLEKAMGVEFGASPAGTGWKLVKLLHPEWFDPITDIELSKCHFGLESGKDFIFSRIPTKEEMSGLYLHKFDKNSAYPAAAAAADANYGVGTPEHKIGDCWDRKAVGVWRCTVPQSAKQHGLLPAIWSRRGEWLAGPHIRLLKDFGHEVEIHEGYVFPESHRSLSLWANRIWDIRIGFDSAEWKHPLAKKFAKMAMKQIAVSTIGLTAYKKFEDTALDKKRPDIRMQTVARNAEMIYHNMVKWQGLGYGTPILIYMDAVYMIGRLKDGRKEYPEIVKRADKLGGWKYEGSVPYSSEVKQLLLNKNESTILSILNLIGWEK